MTRHFARFISIPDGIGTSAVLDRTTGWPGPEQPHDHHWQETSTEADRAAGLRHYVCDCTARRTVRGESEVPA